MIRLHPTYALAFRAAIAAAAMVLSLVSAAAGPPPATDNRLTLSLGSTIDFPGVAAWTGPTDIYATMTGCSVTNTSRNRNYTCIITASTTATEFTSSIGDGATIPLSQLQVQDQTTGDNGYYSLDHRILRVTVNRRSSKTFNLNFRLHLMGDEEYGKYSLPVTITASVSS